jgi:hypothetical protein
MARAQGKAVVAEILDAEVRLAIDTGRPARFLEIGRLAAEALAAGLDVGMTGEQVWEWVNDGRASAKMHGLPLHTYPGANRWQLTAGMHGMLLASGVVIQGGQ